MISTYNLILIVTFRLAECVDEILKDNDHTGYAVFIDKNILPNQFTALEKQLTSFKTKLSKYNIVSKTVGLVPKCLHPVNTSEGQEHKHSHPFSMNYLLQTYLRTHHRKDHPTINPAESYLKPVSISCFFYNQFKRVEFKQQNNKFVCVDHASKNQLEFDQFVEIEFTKESEHFPPPEAFVKAANEVIYYKGKPSFCEDEALLKKFYDCVEFYRSVFRFGEGEFNQSDVDNVIGVIDTKGPEIKVKKPQPKTKGKYSI